MDIVMIITTRLRVIGMVEIAAPKLILILNGTFTVPPVIHVKYHHQIVWMPGLAMDIVMTITIRLTAIMMELMMEEIAAIITLYILTNIAKIVTVVVMNGPIKNVKGNVKATNVRTMRNVTRNVRNFVVYVSKP